MSLKTVKRYSEAFKMQVVQEAEKEGIPIKALQKKYGITGEGTIERWIRKLGKEHLLPRRIRIERLDEVDRIKALEAEKQRLESALAQAHLKVVCLETLVEVAEEETGIDFKKNFGPRAFPESKKVGKRKKRSGRWQ